MDQDFIREHVEATASRDEREKRTVLARIAIVCWPGGTADRTEPGALPWIRRWLPGEATLALPQCSCAGGRCTMCN